MKAHESAFVATQVIGLPMRDAGVTAAVVRVHPSRIDTQRKNPAKFHRRQPVTLVNQDNGAKVVRFVLGGNQKDCKVLSKATVAIDYDTRAALGLGRECGQQVAVRPAAFMEIVDHYVNHEDMGYKLPMRIALLGLALGSLDVALSLAEHLVGLLV